MPEQLPPLRGWDVLPAKLGSEDALWVQQQILQGFSGLKLEMKGVIEEFLDEIDVCMRKRAAKLAEEVERVAADASLTKEKLDSTTRALVKLMRCLDKDLSIDDVESLSVPTLPSSAKVPHALLDCCDRGLRTEMNHSLMALYTQLDETLPPTMSTMFPHHDDPVECEDEEVSGTASPDSRFGRGGRDHALTACVDPRRSTDDEHPVRTRLQRSSDQGSGRLRVDPAFFEVREDSAKRVVEMSYIETDDSSCGESDTDAPPETTGPVFTPMYYI